MPGYVIAQIEVTDPAVFEEYRQLVPPTIAKYGGTYVVRGGATETMEGQWAPKRLVILRFDSVARAREWYDSPEYTEVREYRFRSAKSEVIFAEGV